MSETAENGIGRAESFQSRPAEMSTTVALWSFKR